MMPSMLLPPKHLLPIAEGQFVNCHKLTRLLEGALFFSISLQSHVML
jgi:hypothetical protein